MTRPKRPARETPVNASGAPGSVRGHLDTSDTPDTVQRPPEPDLDPLRLQACALSALQTVAGAADAPMAARAAAARTLLEYVGAIGRHAPEPPARAAVKPASEMSLSELDAAIAALDD